MLSFEERRERSYSIWYLQVDTFNYDVYDKMCGTNYLVCMWESEDDYYIPHAKHYFPYGRMWLYLPNVINNKRVIINDNKS